MNRRTWLILITILSLVLPGCSVGESKAIDIDTIEEMATEEAEAGNFTDIAVENIQPSPRPRADVLVSVEGCRIRLKWNEEDGLRVRIKEVDDLPGKLTADTFRALDGYEECALMPVPGQPRTTSNFPY